MKVDEIQEARNHIIRLLYSLDRVNLECFELDHRKGNYHQVGEPCPELNKIRSAIKDAQEYLDRKIGQ